VPASDAPLAGGHGEITESRLLQSIVEVARIVFGAAAASVFLLDQQSDELVFEAVAGEGEDQLIGTRFPSSTGLAGWVVMSGQALLVDDVTQSPQFAREAAESTGYVPSSIMAAPLIADGECIGVLEVLDRGTRTRDELSDVDLIGMLATEAALGLQLLIRLRWQTASSLAAASGADIGALRRIAERLPAASEPVASTVSRLLATADDLLAGDPAAASGALR
jgi:GAF domain-containing protein